MHRLVAFEPDPVADEIVEAAIHDLKTLWRMSDLIPHVDLEPKRIFRSCLRLVAAGTLSANLDTAISHHAHIWRKTP